MEVRKGVTSIQVNLHCNICNKEMKPTGEMLASNPPWYPYICPVCGYKENKSKTYPFIEYKTEA